MHKFTIGLIAIALAACQTAPPKPNPDTQDLKDKLQALETALTTEPFNRSAYTRSAFSIAEVGKKAPVKVYADVNQVIIDQAYVMGSWEQCENSVEIPYEMKGYCWEENTPIFKAIFNAYPDIKNDASIRAKYLSNDGYFYSRDKIVSRLLAKTKADIKMIQSKLE